MVKLWSLIESKPLNRLWQSAVRERLAKYVKYTCKASLFYFYLYFYFFPGLAYWSNPCMECHARWLKTRVVTQGSAFWGPHDGRQHFGVQIPPKPSKMAFYKHVRACVREWTQDEWRHRRLTSLASLRCSLPSWPSIYIASGESTAAVYFQVIKH